MSPVKSHLITCHITSHHITSHTTHHTLQTYNIQVGCRRKCKVRSGAINVRYPGRKTGYGLITTGYLPRQPETGDVL